MFGATPRLPSPHHFSDFSMSVFVVSRHLEVSFSPGCFPPRGALVFFLSIDSLFVLTAMMSQFF